MKPIENILHHSDVSEKEIEKYLCARCKDIGALCLKYSNPGAVGYPDRLIVLPGSCVVWIELKSKGRRPTRIQLARHEQLRALGHSVFVIDSKDLVDSLIHRLAL